MKKLRILLTIIMVMVLSLTMFACLIPDDNKTNEVKGIDALDLNLMKNYLGSIDTENVTGLKLKQEETNVVSTKPQNSTLSFGPKSIVASANETDSQTYLYKVVVTEGAETALRVDFTKEGTITDELGNEVITQEDLPAQINKLYVEPTLGLTFMQFIPKIPQDVEPILIQGGMATYAMSPMADQPVADIPIETETVDIPIRPESSITEEGDIIVSDFDTNNYYTDGYNVGIIMNNDNGKLYQMPETVTLNNEEVPFVIDSINGSNVTINDQNMVLKISEDNNLTLSSYIKEDIKDNYTEYNDTYGNKYILNEKYNEYNADLNILYYTEQNLQFDEATQTMLAINLVSNYSHNPENGINYNLDLTAKKITKSLTESNLKTTFHKNNIVGELATLLEDISIDDKYEINYILSSAEDDYTYLEGIESLTLIEDGFIYGSFNAHFIKINLLDNTAESFYAFDTINNMETYNIYNKVIRTNTSLYIINRFDNYINNFYENKIELNTNLKIYNYGSLKLYGKENGNLDPNIYTDGIYVDMMNYIEASPNNEYITQIDFDYIELKNFNEIDYYEIANEDGSRTQYEIIEKDGKIETIVRGTLEEEIPDQVIIQPLN